MRASLLRWQDQMKCGQRAMFNFKIASISSELSKQAYSLRNPLRQAKRPTLEHRGTLLEPRAPNEKPSLGRSNEIGRWALHSAHQGSKAPRFGCEAQGTLHTQASSHQSLQQVLVRFERVDISLRIERVS
ncbi:unnamed protein product [Effrenium voratum]|nr:unnamed protein product [Effrenium voratum]